MNPFFEWWLNSTKIACIFLLSVTPQFCFYQLPFPILPNQLNVCFVVVWNMNSRYLHDLGGIVKELLVVFPARPEQNLSLLHF